MRRVPRSAISTAIEPVPQKPSRKEAGGLPPGPPPARAQIRSPIQARSSLFEPRYFLLKGA